MLKKILLVLLAGLVIIQFIHPAKNQSAGPQPNYIGNNYAVPPELEKILVKACNDCHSNNTQYPWYSKLQPVDWWLTSHVNDGKKSLNLDDFTNRRLRYQYRKLEEIAELVKTEEMPLNSYTWIHKEAILTEAEKAIIFSWTDNMRDSLEARYPMDSLVRKK